MNFINVIFNLERVLFLSEDEKEWLKNHGDIVIGFLNDDIGVSVMDPKTKMLSGVISDYVILAQNCLQNETLEFELRGYDTRQEQLEALEKGEIDLIFHFSQNPYVAETNNFVLSDTVWTFNMAAISLKNGFDESGDNSVAICKDNIALKAYVSYNYPNWDIVEYDDFNATIKAVLDGEADCFLSNSGVALNYLKNNKLQSVFLTKPANTSFAIKQNEPLLLSIMNKTLMYMPTSKLSGAVVSYSNALQKVSVKEFIQDNVLILSTVLTSVFLVIMFIILRLLHKSKKSALAALQANKKLEENQKELQKALVEAQSAIKAKTTFLNNMSHDIRTPINGIIGMLNILEKNENDPKQVHECIDKIGMSSRLLLSLINDVLDMAKLDSGASIIDNESIDISKVCEEITTTLLFQAQEAGIEVNIEHDDYDGLYVYANSLYLKKVLMNLFTNSIKYNKLNGSIHLSMKTLKRTEDDISIEFKIQDTGIGMSKDFVENKLFVPFVQAENTPRTNYMGTGLGMPIVKSIVEKMNGTIDVTSVLGEGTCFRVVLPFKIDNTPKINNNESIADIKGLNILLVEDNDLNVEIAKYMLTDSGAKVTVAYNGQEALKLFEASKPYTYDAILMDVMMPIMDGLTATRKIRELERDDAKEVVIIAMTANVFKEDRDKCLKAGMNDHLGKPLEIEKVKKSIVEQIEKHPTRKEEHEKN